MGEDELVSRVFMVRDMRGSAQEEVPEDALLAYLKEKIDG